MYVIDALIIAYRGHKERGPDYAQCVCIICAQKRVNVIASTNVAINILCSGK
jgi:hypothetical protein